MIVLRKILLSLVWVGIPAALAADLQLAPLEFTGALPLDSAEMAVFPDKDGLQLVYTSLLARRPEIFWRRKVGDKWGEPERVSDEQGTGSAGPVGLLDRAGRLHVSWLSREGRGIYTVRQRTRSSDGNWGPVNSFQAGGDKPALSMVEDGQGRIYLSYRTTVKAWKWGRIFLYVSEDGGGSWRLSDPNYPDEAKIGFCNSPHMVAVGNVVTLAWIDQSPGGQAVVANSTADGGRTWLEEPLVLSREPLAYRDPKLVEVGGRLHVVWSLNGRDPIGSFQALYDVHQDGQGNWSLPRQVYRSRASSLRYVVGAPGGRLVFAAVESRQVYPSRLVFKSYWENNDYLESEPEEIWLGGAHSQFSGLNLVMSGDVVGVMFSEQGGAQSGARLHLRRYPELGWQHFELSKEAEKLNKERGDVDAMVPVGFLDPEGRGLSFLFHLVERRRFLEEQTKLSTQLVFGRLDLAP